MKTSDLWNKFIAETMNEKQMNFSYADFQKAINERVNTELRWIPIEEEIPTEFEKQLLVKNVVKENGLQKPLKMLNKWQLILHVAFLSIGYNIRVCAHFV